MLVMNAPTNGTRTNGTPANGIPANGIPAKEVRSFRFGAASCQPYGSVNINPSKANVLNCL